MMPDPGRKTRILVADDEAAARGVLVDILRSQWPDAEVSEAATGAEALARLDAVAVDLALMDIDMPVMDGLTAALRIQQRLNPPLLVFVTAFDAHAVRGFELNAIDFVLKPVDPQRLALTLRRARDALDTRASADAYRNRVQTYLSRRAAAADRLWAHQSNGAKVLLPVSRLDWAQARDKAVFLRAGADELCTRLTLDALAEQLPADDFLRVHRAWLVNLDRVAGAMPWGHHSVTLIMDDAEATEIPVGRTYVGTLKRYLGW